MTQSVIAVVIAGLGTFATAVGGLLAQAAPANPESTIAPWLYGGGSVAAVACLAYIARQFANGSVVARNTAEVAREAEEREDQLAQLLQASHEREATYLELLKGRMQP